MPDGDHALLSKIAPRVDWPRIPSPDEHDRQLRRLVKHDHAGTVQREANRALPPRPRRAGTVRGLPASKA